MTDQYPRPVVMHDPGIGWGRATMRAIPTEVIASLFWAENGDAAAVCDDYGLGLHELAVALWYEATHGEARTAFGGWAQWADEVAYPRLAGWKELDIGTLPLPPGRDERNSSDQPAR